MQARAMANSTLEQKVFLGLLVAVTVAFAWMLFPYYGAVFWAVILAIIFAPLQRWLMREFGNRPNSVALLTLLVSLLVAVLPVIFITGMLIQEGASLYNQIESGKLDVGKFFTDAKELLPQSVQALMQRFGFSNFDQMRDRLAAGALEGSQFLATKAFSFGQGTFQFVVSTFVMLYLLFFLLRDGRELLARVRKAIPLTEIQKRRLFSKFTRVVRATVKGNVVIAAIQGALGAIAFAVLGVPGAILWGVLMGFLSLLPAVGAGIVWAPVAVFFFVSGQIFEGVALTAFGVLVIGLVDNLLRPILVGKDTKMPDYIVLISTLGGLALFGLNGFVIGPLIAALFISTWTLFVTPEGDSPI